MDSLLEQINQDSPAALTTLSRILGNVVASPDNAKYRILKKTSKAMADDIVRNQAAMSLLLAVGFNDCGDTLDCPMDADLQNMSEAVDLIAALQLSRGDGVSSGAKQTPTIVAGVIVKKTVAAPQAPSADPATFQRKTEKSQDTFRAALGAAQGKARAGEGEAQFKRRERPSTSEADELQKMREARKNQYVGAPATDVSSISTTASSVATLEPELPALPARSGSKKKGPSAFDFQDRREKARKEEEAAQAMEDMRRAQKEKYSKALEDPSAFKSEAYAQPPSVAKPASSQARWCCLLGGGRA